MSADKFEEEFGVSESEMFDRLLLLRNSLQTANELFDPDDHQARHSAMQKAMMAVSWFFAGIEEFRDDEMMSLIQNDIDRTGKGSSAITITPLKNHTGRPSDSNVLQILKGWSAAYMELLRRSGLSIPQAAEKAARDLNARGWVFSSGRDKANQVTPRRVRGWRDQCLGSIENAGPAVLLARSTYVSALIVADATQLEDDQKAAHLLNRIKPSQFAGYFPEPK